MKLNIISETFSDKFNLRIFQFQYEPTKEDSYWDSDISEFRDWDLEKLPRLDVLWYEYRTGSYSGSGIWVGKIKNAITQEDKWYHWDCGHCSCYWPTEDAEDDGPVDFKKIQEILKENYPEMLQHIERFIF